MSTSSCTGSATETQSQHVLCISDRLTVGWVCASLSVVPWDCMTIRGKIPLKGTRTVRHRSGQVLPSRCPVQVTSLQPRSRCKSESHPHLGLNRTNSFLFIEEGGKKKINKQERKVTMSWTWFTGKVNCQGIQAKIHRWFIKQVIEMSKERAIERSPSSSPPLIISYCWKWPFLQVSRPFWSAEDFRKWKLVLKGTKVLQKHFIKGCILLLSSLPLGA